MRACLEQLDSAHRTLELPYRSPSIGAVVYQSQTLL